MGQPISQRGADFGGPLHGRHVAAIGHDHELAAGDLVRPSLACCAGGLQPSSRPVSSKAGQRICVQDARLASGRASSARTCAAKISGVLRDIISMIVFTRAVSLMRRESIIGGSHFRSIARMPCDCASATSSPRLRFSSSPGRACRQRQIAGIEQRDAIDPLAARAGTSRARRARPSNVRRWRIARARSRARLRPSLEANRASRNRGTSNRRCPTTHRFAAARPSGRRSSQAAAGDVRGGYTKSSERIGSLRSRLPVAAKIALATAGIIDGVLASPIPPGAAWLGTMCTSTTGISSMRSTS